MFFVIPLHSRLHCNHIEVGLITNRFKNRSESPFECRTHVEEETGEIHFNPCNLKPNLRVNRVSSVIWL